MSYLDLSIVTEAHLVRVFGFDATLIFFRVATRTESVLDTLLRPRRVTVLKSELNCTFASVRGSITPSEYARLYLSSSNGRKNRLGSSTVTVPRELEILRVYCFLISISELSMLREEIYLLGRGVNKADSVPPWIPALIIPKSET